MERLNEMLIAIYCDVDEYCKAFEEYWHTHLVTDGRAVIPKCSMSLSEIMTIVIFFHLSDHRTFKWYYKDHICGSLAEYFPNALSYNRFVEVMQSAIVPLTVYNREPREKRRGGFRPRFCRRQKFRMKYRLGKCSGISFLDSTTLDVCHNRRIHSHKVFKDIASRGKSSTGWFFGFKLHIIINDKGEILSFCLTSGNVDDRDWKTISKLTAEIYGKLFADKGYLSQKLFEKLFEKDITLVTKIKKNMKNRLMDLQDKILLRKRAVIESVNDFLKNICQIEHSRHRSVANFIVNLLAGLAAYSFIPQKPSLHLSPRLLIAD